MMIHTKILNCPHHWSGQLMNNCKQWYACKCLITGSLGGKKEKEKPRFRLFANFCGINFYSMTILSHHMCKWEKVAKLAPVS